MEKQRRSESHERRTKAAFSEIADAGRRLKEAGSDPDARVAIDDELEEAAADWRSVMDEVIGPI